MACCRPGENKHTHTHPHTSFYSERPIATGEAALCSVRSQRAPFPARAGTGGIRVERRQSRSGFPGRALGCGVNPGLSGFVPEGTAARRPPLKANPPQTLPHKGPPPFPSAQQGRSPSFLQPGAIPGPVCAPPAPAPAGSCEGRSGPGHGGGGGRSGGAGWGRAAGHRPRRGQRERVPEPEQSLRPRRGGGRGRLGGVAQRHGRRLLGVPARRPQPLQRAGEGGRAGPGRGARTEPRAGKGPGGSAAPGAGHAPGLGPGRTGPTGGRVPSLSEAERGESHGIPVGPAVV